MPKLIHKTIAQGHIDGIVHTRYCVGNPANRGFFVNGISIAYNEYYFNNSVHWNANHAGSIDYVYQQLNKGE